MLDSDAYYQRSFSRNTGLIDDDEQQALRDTRVAIPGMGGMGGVHAAALARTGIGRFTIADFDHFEVHNMNRQYGSTASSIGKSKAHVMRDIILDINPSASITLINEPVGMGNMSAFLQDVDIVIDALDISAVQARRDIFRSARDIGIPVYSAGPVGFSTVMFILSPDGMEFDTFTGIRDGMSELEAKMRFLAALGAQGSHLKYMDLSKVKVGSGAAPSLGLACQLGAAVVATEVVCHVTGRRKARAVPWITQIDPMTRSYTQRYRWLGAKNPLQMYRTIMLARQLSDKR